MTPIVIFASPAISAFFTASGPFLGLSRIASAAVASTAFAGELFLLGSAGEEIKTYLDKNGYLPQEEILRTITVIALFVITSSSLLWGGMYCASAALSLASFSIEPFSPLMAFTSTGASTAITLAAMCLEEFFFPED